MTGATERTGADVTKLPASFGLFMLPSHERTVEVRRSAPDANPTARSAKVDNTGSRS